MHLPHTPAKSISASRPLSWADMPRKAAPRAKNPAAPIRVAIRSYRGEGLGQQGAQEHEEKHDDDDDQQLALAAVHLLLGRQGAHVKVGDGAEIGLQDFHLIEEIRPHAKDCAHDGDAHELRQGHGAHVLQPQVEQGQLPAPDGRDRAADDKRQGDAHDGAGHEFAASLILQDLADAVKDGPVQNDHRQGAGEDADEGQGNVNDEHKHVGTALQGLAGQHPAGDLLGDAIVVQRPGHDVGHGALEDHRVPQGPGGGGVQAAIADHGQRADGKNGGPAHIAGGEQVDHADEDAQDLHAHLGDRLNGRQKADAEHQDDADDRVDEIRLASLFELEIRSCHVVFSSTL